LFGGTSQTLLQFLVSENAMETTFHHSSLWVVGIFLDIVDSISEQEDPFGFSGFNKCPHLPSFYQLNKYLLV
jgi:hypothetical protein